MSTTGEAFGPGIAVAASPAWAPVLATLMRAIAEGPFLQVWSADALERVLSDRSHGVLVAVDPGEAPQGLVALRRAADEAEILHLGVLPVERRRGCGRRLVAAGLAWAARNGAARCFLEVADGNLGAQRLYQGAGFRPVGRRRDYYRGRDAEGRPVRADAIVMAIRLTRGSP